MENQNKKPNLGTKSYKKWILCPLLIVLMGIFLLPKTAYLSTISDEKIIELTNIERNKRDLGSLTANQLLIKAAYDKASALMKSQTFQHTINDRKFSSWVREAGYEYSYVGENLAIDFVSSEGTIKAWLDSPTHRSNLLNEKFNEIGIAIVEGSFQGQNTTLVVQIFGTPLLQESAVEKNLELMELKNSDNNLSEFNIENENLLTNAQNNPASIGLLSTDIEIQNPENYLTVLKINPASASGEKIPSTFNFFNLFLYFIFITFLSIIANFFFYNSTLLKKEEIQQQ